MFSLRSAPPPPSLWEELELRASYLQFKVKAAKVANPSKTSQTNNTCVYNTNHAMSMMNNDVNESLGVSLSAGGLPFWARQESNGLCAMVMTDIDRAKAHGTRGTRLGRRSIQDPSGARALPAPAAHSKASAGYVGSLCYWQLLAAIGCYWQLLMLLMLLAQLELGQMHQFWGVYPNPFASFCIWVANSFFAQPGPAATGVSSPESPGVKMRKQQPGSARSRALRNFEFYIL